MSQARTGDTVKIHYAGTLDDGTLFDSSEDRDPLEFTLGTGTVIPGFDDAVTGMSVGEKKRVRIPPEEAYGERHEGMIQDVPRSALPPDFEVEPGMPLQAQGPDGQVIRLTVIETADDSIKVDANHPLAGEALNFDLELVAVA